jgi:hypothetical protein
LVEDSQPRGFCFVVDIKFGFVGENHAPAAQFMMTIPIECESSSNHAAGNSWRSQFILCLK